MAKRKRTKYSHGGFHINSETIEKLAASVDVSQDQGVTKYSGSIPVGEKNIVNANVGAGRNKGNSNITFSRQIGAGRVSATLGRQPKHHTSGKYGKETYGSINLMVPF